MRLWITCFFLLFAVAEILQWLKQFSLPLPIYILGGAFLAIAANADKQTSLPLPWGNHALRQPTVDPPPMAELEDRE